MNIAMFTDAYWPRVNGVTVSVDSYSKALIKAGHEVLVVCSYYPESLNIASSILDNPKAEEGPKVVRVPSLPLFLSKEDRIAKFNKWYWVLKQVENFSPDIIHINSEFMIAEFGFFYALVHNLPAIYTFHTMWEDYGPNYFPVFPPLLVKFFIRQAHKAILRRSYRVIVPTRQIDDVVKKYRSKTDTYLLPTGIETGLFEHDEEKSALFRKKLEELYPELKGKRILLFAGRVAKEKNLVFLLKVLAKVVTKHSDVILLVVGNGPDLDYFSNKACSLGLEDSCVFTGYLDRRDLSLIYTISEVFVFPSLTDTQGLVTLESMLSGTPVVAIGALGTLMVMGGDNGGFMVKNDEAEFTARVLELLEDKELHRQKSLEAIKHAHAWSIEELTKKLVAIYETTVAAYREENGEPRTPVWELMKNKKWREINNKIIKKRAYRKWNELIARLSEQLTNEER